MYLRGLSIVTGHKGPEQWGGTFDAWKAQTAMGRRLRPEQAEELIQMINWGVG